METSWITDQTKDQLKVIHDNRWLAIIGIPLSLFGLVVGIGPWLIASARQSDAWPILAVGSLIGSGLVVAGLALCFKFESLLADKQTNALIQRKGLPPFQRTRQWSLNDLSEVTCLAEHMASSSGHSSSQHFRLRLDGPGSTILVASSLEQEPILFEARRWADFLGLPLTNKLPPT